MNREEGISSYAPYPPDEASPRGLSRAQFLKLSGAGALGAVLGEGLVVRSAGAQVAGEPVRGSGLYGEAFRDQFHFSPERYWMNDPNGMVYYRGEYHLFFQHNPYGIAHENLSWGHAVSPDMVAWEELPVALLPDELGQIFSGSAVVDWYDTSGLFGGGEGMVAFYTSAGETQQQSLAYSTDRGRSWTKYAGNPVIPNPGLEDFRDPKVIWHYQSQKWVMAVAAGDRILFYGSENLIDWQKLSEFGSDEGAHGGVWECPELFEQPVGDTGRRRWVLEVDINPGGVNGGSAGQYFIGEFDGERFVNANPPDTVLWVDWGKDFYAAQAWNNVPASDGRRLWLAWMNNWDYAEEIPTDPWRGTMTLPREVTLADTPDGARLVQRPVRELESLRSQRYSRRDIPVGEAGAREEGDGGPVPLDGRTVEIVAEFEARDAEEFGFRVRQGERGQRTLIGYSASAGKLFVDRSRSGITDIGEGFAGRHEAPVPLENGRTTMRIFVDRSSVEVFAGGGGTVITERIFPRGEAEEFEPYAEGGQAVLTSLEVYDLTSIWSPHVETPRTGGPPLTTAAAGLAALGAGALGLDALRR